ncbi:putative zinc-binding metallopeptidase [Fibrobacterota bacterium]
MTSAGKKKQVPIKWEQFTDEELLKTRVRDLRLRIEETPLEDRISRLYAELEERRITFHPPCYLADEWLTPDGIPMIGIPFFLAHPRLTQLEKKMMLEAEGSTDAWCMKLLRHETGHAINYAYRFYRRTRWRELFGPYSTHYSTAYSAQPYSRRFVSHLEDNYAQAHPDEDFAETFAVWLTPGSKWKERYAGWPALKKLLYVDHLAGEIRQKPPLVTRRETPWSALRMRSTLAALYDRKRRELGEDFQGFYDPGLQRLFTIRASGPQSPKASKFLRQKRRQIVNSVCMWTGDRKYDIDKLVRRLSTRCQAMGLYLNKPETDTIFETAAFVTAVAAKKHHFKKGAEDK